VAVERLGEAEPTEPVGTDGAAARGARRFHCENCGAEVATSPDQRSYICPFCNSTYVVELPPAVTGRQTPEFIIGFAVTRDAARNIFRRWITHNRWFRPRDLRTAEIVDRLQGVYLPFWSFSMVATSRWSAQIGEYWDRTDTYTDFRNGKPVVRTRRVRETEWWPLEGRHHQYLSGYLVSASRGLPQEEARRIGPFRLGALHRYAPYFLAGWMCEEYSVPREQAETRCREAFRQRVRRDVEAFLPGDTNRHCRVQTEWSHTGSDLLLLPVYIATYRYQENVFRIVINGQTGRVAGEKPISRVRLGAAVAAGLALVGLAALAIWLAGR